jgi:D-alanyl-D-alanine carboxypeptidase/D-alanyl-D-alanine-endopeptidase (penicillin-binding protein 4)
MYKMKKYNRALLTGLLSAALFVSVNAQDIVPTPLKAERAATSSDTLFADTVYIDTLSSQNLSYSWDERVKLALDQFAREADRAPYYAGISVWDLTADSFLWGYNSQKVMRPASTQKVLTAISALSIIGAQHEIKTRTYYTGSIAEDGTLSGDLYVVGDFDPMYSHADLKELARAIRDAGIKRVSGKIYGDASMKNADLYGNGWCWDDVPSKYQPYHCALMVERGREYPNFGTYSKSASFHPAAHFVYALGHELKNLGITGVSAAIVPYGTTDYPGGGTLCHTKTRTIEQVLQRMLKNSDNYHAEAVFYQLANAAKSKNCSWKDGAQQVESVIRKAGASTVSLEVADGSGVSLYNYVTPDIEVALLRYAYKNPSIYQPFYAALPIAGVDGTLDERMKTGNAYRNVHAKTGTVEGVSALAGYVTASNGHLLAFSIIVNGTLTSKVARDYQDRICQELAR